MDFRGLLICPAGFGWYCAHCGILPHTGRLSERMAHNGACIRNRGGQRLGIMHIERSQSHSKVRFNAVKAVGGRTLLRLAAGARLLMQVSLQRGILIESDIPVVVPRTRLDSRQAEDALLSTIAFGAGRWKGHDEHRTRRNSGSVPH
jgi:hypothetical protein